MKTLALALVGCLCFGVAAGVDRHSNQDFVLDEGDVSEVAICNQTDAWNDCEDGIMGPWQSQYDMCMAYYICASAACSAESIVLVGWGLSDLLYDCLGLDGVGVYAEFFGYDSADPALLELLWSVAGHGNNP